MAHLAVVTCADAPADGVARLFWPARSNFCCLPGKAGDLPQTLGNRPLLAAGVGLDLNLAECDLGLKPQGKCSLLTEPKRESADQDRPDRSSDHQTAGVTTAQRVPNPSAAGETKKRPMCV